MAPVIQAVTPRGEMAGCAVVTVPGHFGVMQLYGEDADDSTPGFQEGEPIRWRVNGAWAAGSAELTWADDREVHQLDLDVHEPTEPSRGASPIFVPFVVK